MSASSSHRLAVLPPPAPASRRHPASRRQAPVASDLSVYVVACRQVVDGKAVVFYRERDTADADHEATIRDIMTGQIDSVHAVFAFNPFEGWSRDVTEDIAIEIAHRIERSQPVSEDVIDLIERRAGLEYARGLKRATPYAMAAE
jgi:hypothetical protein